MGQFLAPIFRVLFILIFFSCSPRGFKVVGEVRWIEPGKDGYTATIRDRYGREYMGVISRTDHPGVYRELVIGEVVKLEGDTLHAGESVLIKVKSLKSGKW